jgi:hypothetical protein
MWDPLNLKPKEVVNILRLLYNQGLVDAIYDNLWVDSEYKQFLPFYENKALRHNFFLCYKDFIKTIPEECYRNPKIVGGETLASLARRANDEFITPTLDTHKQVNGVLIPLTQEEKDARKKEKLKELEDSRNSP